MPCYRSQDLHRLNTLEQEYKMVRCGLAPLPSCVTLEGMKKYLDWAWSNADLPLTREEEGAIEEYRLSDVEPREGHGGMMENENRANMCDTFVIFECSAAKGILTHRHCIYYKHDKLGTECWHLGPEGKRCTCEAAILAASKRR